MKAGKKLKKVKAGDSYSAKDQNDIVDEAQRMGDLTVTGAADAMNGPGGMVIHARGQVVIYAQITAVDGNRNYTWQEQYPAAGGGWTPAPRSGGPGNDPAFEGNGVIATAFPFNVIMRRGRTSGQWIFWLDTCL
jgi:hypothetical protein